MAATAPDRAPVTSPAVPPSVPPSAPPDVPGLPLLGSALALRRDLLGTLLRAMREQGDVVRFAVGPPGARFERYGVFSPDGVQRVLATESTRYRKDNIAYAELRAAFGDGLLTSQDDRWLRQKRFLQPVFTRRRVAGYLPVLAAEADDLVERWRPVAAARGTVDLHAEMTRVTLRIVARVLFGADVDAAVPAVRDAFPALAVHALRRTVAPVRPPRSWPLPSYRRAVAAQRALYDLCDELIAARRAAPTGGDDLLSLLLSARDGGESLDDREIRDQVLIFLLAGHETTATALTFALHLLGRDPTWQRRTRSAALDGPLVADAVPDVLTQVLKEAMRLYPSAFGTGRRVAAGDVVDGRQIPPGADVIVSTWATHRHPRHWDDPERFDPSRFTPEREAARHRYAWFPFGGGPRACIGQGFALLEGAVVLAAVLSAYDVATPAGPVPLETGLTLRPAGPVPCRLAPLVP